MGRPGAATPTARACSRSAAMPGWCPIPAATVTARCWGRRPRTRRCIATGSLSSFTSSNFGDVLRWTDGNNWYKAYIDGANLVIQKKVAGTTTILATVPFAATAGTSYTIHFRVVGSTLTANVWPASGTEPAGWMITVSDSSLTSGYCGMRFLTQSGTATITAFQANTV